MLICQNPECKKEFIQNPNYRAGIQQFCSEKCRKHFFSKEQYAKLKLEIISQTPKDISEKLQILANEQQDANGFKKLKPNCEVCGSTKNLLCHEISYSPLKTITLCAKCHGLLHHRFLKRKKVRP